MISFLKLIKAELLMLRGEIKNYYLNYIFYNLGILVLFLGFIYNFSDTNDNLLMLIGLVIWQLSTGSMNYLSNVIQDEAMMGTLEQIFLSKTKIQIIFLSKIFVNMIFILFKALLLFIIVIIINNNEMDFSNISLLFIFASIIVVTVITLAFYFLGQFFGALCLYFKRVGSITAAVGNVLLLFSGVINNVDKNNFIYYLTPISSGMNILNQIRINSFYDFWFHLIYFSFVSIVYILGGIMTFKFIINKAKITGNLGQY